MPLADLRRWKIDLYPNLGVNVAESNQYPVEVKVMLSKDELARWLRYTDTILSINTRAARENYAAVIVMNEVENWEFSNGLSHDPTRKPSE